MRQNIFRAHIENKFGKHITDSILDSVKLKLLTGKKEELYKSGFLKLNNEKIRNLLPEWYNDIEKKEWAFDFPGWIGELDFTKNNAKEIMIIGMEPHIGYRDFQVTYGLRETSENEFDEIDEFKPNEMLWRNLFGIFGKGSNYKSKEFLNRFYITDMSHFAVQGQANEMLIFKNWAKIREEVAQSYLVNEIELILPNYIVSQSNVVADFIEYKFLDKKGEIIATKETGDFKTELPMKCKTSPVFKKYRIFNQEIIHLRLPHLGSPNANYFWTPAQKENRERRLNGIATELKEFANKKE